VLEVAEELVPFGVGGGAANLALNIRTVAGAPGGKIPEADSSS
jgi:hypothetical protein